MLQKKLHCLVIRHVQRFVSGPNIDPVVGCIFLFTAVEEKSFLSEYFLPSEACGIKMSVLLQLPNTAVGY